MRIVAGKHAGRTLQSPQGSRVRPTAEGVRARILDLVTADLPKARVLDLFAGTGAFGLEALSRGATWADFVEVLPDSLHALRANIALLRVLKVTRVFKRDALPFAAALVPASYDIAFVDPPYGSKMLDRVIEGWLGSPFSRVLAVEHARGHELPGVAWREVMGETGISIYRAQSVPG